jgi:hypothetical protein
MSPRSTSTASRVPARPTATGGSTSPARHARQAQLAHRRRQRRRLFGLALVLVVGTLIAVDVLRDPPARPRWSVGLAGPTSDAPTTAPTPAARSAAPRAAGRVAVTQKGPGTFGYAGGTGLVFGRSGRVQRYRVAVEKGSGVTPGEFAGRVEAILGDTRSWIGGGRVRLQRVPGDVGDVDFTVYLATPVTSEAMCREDGLRTERYTSCRLASGKVVINLARWLTAVPGYGAPLETYQAYAINHEVGHQLGQGHEACLGPGRLAPVMQQQTLGLRGCVANAWPYVEGSRYAGPAVP